MLSSGSAWEEEEEEGEGEGEGEGEEEVEVEVERSRKQHRFRLARTNPSIRGRARPSRRLKGSRQSQK